ncbi:hypothetical protein PTKIN_Ptkin05aG0134600 [Pterospermum kingtungense]
MQYQVSFSTPSISIFTFFFISLFLLPISHSKDDKNLAQCLSHFDCGDIKNLTFPFWMDGRPSLCRVQESFRLTTCRGPKPLIDIGGDEFQLIYFNPSTSTMTIARNIFCPENPINNHFLRYSPTNNQNLTFFLNCDSNKQLPSNHFQSRCQGLQYSVYWSDSVVDRDDYEEYKSSCEKTIQVQVNQSASAQLPKEGELPEGWALGFDVVYNLTDIFCTNCNRFKGECANLSSPDHLICIYGGTQSFNPWFC